ncbi:hypothetical protein [Zoogloea sp.]|uniref:hypothetical protein n=1 Tax=Zoogloea sp. TaxID=49181 RepID=UPI00260FFC22|nr:hypothetical protein [Zoogloea sp.]MDD3352312.1 hypothetical protein [Zoogloea sp.]
MKSLTKASNPPPWEGSGNTLAGNSKNRTLEQPPPTTPTMSIFFTKNTHPKNPQEHLKNHKNPLVKVNNSQLSQKNTPFFDGFFIAPLYNTRISKRLKHQPRPPTPPKPAPIRDL